jgi:hypothetical protein
LSSPGPDNESGLAERVRLLLGLRDHEEFLLIEQLLLRPVLGDEAQAAPVLTEADVADPYSLRVSFVFASVDGRMQSDSFRRVIWDTVRRETPAHLVAHVQWLEADEWVGFRDAHEQWWRRRRRALEQMFDIGMDVDGDQGGNTDGSR